MSEAREFRSLSWKDGMSAKDFVRHAKAVSKGAKDCNVYFSVHDPFLDAFAAYDTKSATAVLRALKTVPLHSTMFSSFRGPDQAIPTERLQSLFEMLGSLATLQTFSIYCDEDDGYGSWLCEHGISKLPFVKQMTLHTLINVDHASLAASLRGHPSLQTLSLRLPATSFAQVLPAIHNIPKLTDLHISPVYFPPDRALVVKQDMDAIADLIHSDLPIRVMLSSFQWTTSDLDISLDARTDSLVISHCTFYDAVSSGRSLGNAQVKHLTIRNPWFHSGDSNLFLEAFTQGLPTMPALCTLEYSARIFDPCDSAMEQSVVSLIRAAAKCPSLRELRLELPSYTDSMDCALASECIGRKAQLQKITIRCHPLNLEVDRLLKPFRFPAVIDAVIKSGSVQTLVYERIWLNISLTPPRIDPWDADCVKMLAVVHRLNKSGRQPSAKASAIHEPASLPVLEAVADDLDCVFFYLRERPLVYDAAFDAACPAAIPSSLPTTSVSGARRTKPRWHGILCAFCIFYPFKK